MQQCDPIGFAVGYTSISECAARSEPVCASALTANGTALTPSRVEACASAYDSAGCDLVDLSRPPQGCTFSGSLPGGSPCGDDSQCASAHCQIPRVPAQVCGTCADLAPVGGACDSDRACQVGLVCAGTTCAAPVAAGAACDGVTLVCPASLLCLDGVCAAPPQQVVPCDPGADTCDGGLSCDPGLRLCSPGPSASLGAPCGNTTICLPNGYCDSSTHSCAANAADGAACDDTSGPFCTSPALCVNGTCVVPNASSCR